jgi:hypothetical protein
LGHYNAARCQWQVRRVPPTATEWPDSGRVRVDLRLRVTWHAEDSARSPRAPGAGRHLAAPDGQHGPSPSTGPAALAAAIAAPKRGQSSETGHRIVLLKEGQSVHMLKMAKPLPKRMEIKGQRRESLNSPCSLSWQPSRPWSSCPSSRSWPWPTLRTRLVRLVGQSHRRPARPTLTVHHGYAAPAARNAETSVHASISEPILGLVRFQAPVVVTERPTRTPVVNGTERPTRVPIVATERPTRVLPRAVRPCMLRRRRLGHLSGLHPAGRPRACCPALLAPFAHYRS